MDPASGVFSPFHCNVEGRNGLLESAVAELGAATTTGHSGMAEGTSSTTSLPSREGEKKINKPKADGISRRGTPCGECGQNYTTATVPAGGMYLCRDCVAQHEGRPGGNRFPPNTLKCCPASVTEGDDSVVRCWACHGWYHCACLDIHDKALKEYLTLSTTKWYCPEASCCEKVLQGMLKKKR